MSWVKNWLSCKVFYFKLQVKSKESSVSDLTDPCEGLQKQSGLCAETSLIATESLTVKCQPPVSPLSYSIRAVFFFWFLACRWKCPSYFSVTFFFYSVLVDILCYEKMCAKNFYTFKVQFDLNRLIWNVAVNWAKDKYICALTGVCFHFIWKMEEVAIPCGDFMSLLTFLHFINEADTSLLSSGLGQTINLVNSAVGSFNKAPTVAVVL